MMNNPIIITVENLTYSISTELDTTGYSVSQIPFTIPHSIPGQVIRGGVYSIAVSNLAYNIEVEQIYDVPIIYGVGFGIIGSTFIIR